jgi:signal transduction histidine kinase
MRKSTLLVVAFTALLLVLGVSTLAAWRGAKTAQSRASNLLNAHMEARTALNAIRGNVFLNAITTRDYLLDPDSSHRESYLRDFDSIRRNTIDSFVKLQTLTQDPAQNAALRNLQSEFEQYWDPTELLLDWSPQEKRAKGYEMLKLRVRRRQEIFALAEKAQQLIEANFQQERERVSRADRDFQSFLAWTSGIALLFGLAIAGVTLQRMIALEHQSEFAAKQMRQLSIQLRTAQEQERKYLSRELHDQVGQMLTGVRMELSAIARLHANAESEVSQRIAEAKNTVEQTLRIVRNIAMLLRPSMLDDLGLTPALTWLAKEASRSSGMQVHAKLDPALDGLPDALRTCLFRVVQEALTNAARHSGGREVTLVAAIADGAVVGTIADDGRGFNLEKQKRSGLGLLGMEERIKELGGTIRFTSSPNHGTRLEFRLPLPETPEVENDSHPDSGRSRDRAHRVETSA